MKSIQNTMHQLQSQIELVQLMAAIPIQLCTVSWLDINNSIGGNNNNSKTNKLCPLLHSEGISDNHGTKHNSHTNTNNNPQNDSNQNLETINRKPNSITKIWIPLILQRHQTKQLENVIIGHGINYCTMLKAVLK